MVENGQYLGESRVVADDVFILLCPSEKICEVISLHLLDVKFLGLNLSALGFRVKAKPQRCTWLLNQTEEKLEIKEKERRTDIWMWCNNVLT
jgi:hypothetical protein